MVPVATETRVVTPTPKPPVTAPATEVSTDSYAPAGKQAPLERGDTPPVAPPGVDPLAWVRLFEDTPEFQALNPGVQQAVHEKLTDPEVEESGKDVIADAVLTPGFALLSTEEADEFLEYAGNTIPVFGQRVRSTLGAQLAADEYQQAGLSLLPFSRAVAQRQQLLDFSRGDGAVPGTPPLAELPPRVREVHVSAAEDLGEYEFETGKVDAQRYTLDVDGREIEVITPADHPEFTPTPEDLEQLFETLPSPIAEQYDRVVIEPNASDASASTDGDGQIRIFPDSNRTLTGLQPVLVHEGAHNLSEALGETSSIGVDEDLSRLSPGWQRWAAAVEADGHPITQHAASSVAGDNDDHERKFGEDFAETVLMYYRVKGTAAEAELARLYPNRYDLVRQVLGDA
ncbi:MAG: hypothetical protein IPJ65_22185 [Archangiaceae bacterium]|nr:hypothetical protein [Archangiaceae bacterium]